MSLKGKITIMKSLILPQILFLFNLIYVPKNILDQIDDLFFDFLWNGKTPKVKRSTIIGPISFGGLKMVDIYVMHTVAKATWIKRLSSVEQCHWKTLFLKMMGIKETLLNKKVDSSFFKKCFWSRTNLASAKLDTGFVCYCNLCNVEKVQYRLCPITFV